MTHMALLGKPRTTTAAAAALDWPLLDDVYDAAALIRSALTTASVRGPCPAPCAAPPPAYSGLTPGTTSTTRASHSASLGRVRCGAQGRGGAGASPSAADTTHTQAADDVDARAAAAVQAALSGRASATVRRCMAHGYLDGPHSLLWGQNKHTHTHTYSLSLSHTLKE